MAPRTTRKRTVKIAELAFPVALPAGATTAERVALPGLNRKTARRTAGMAGADPRIKAGDGDD